MIGPDGARYLHLAAGNRVPRPFHLRWLLPKVCGVKPARWWAVWWVSWPVMFAAMFVWQSDAGWRVALASAVLLAGLPGILGPAAVIPVGVDLPATALTLASAACWHLGGPVVTVAAWALLVAATATRETAPVWLALWLWSPLPLIALALVAVRHLTTSTGPDPLGPKFDAIAAHPVRAALAAHRGRWRDGWLMVAPWGACLAALHRPALGLVVLLVVAYGQLLVATDTVRLVQHAAGPVMAATAASVFPVGWLPLVCVVHVFWWLTPERV